MKVFSGNTFGNIRQDIAAVLSEREAKPSQRNGITSDRKRSVRHSTEGLRYSTNKQVVHHTYPLFTLTTVPGDAGNPTKLDNLGNSRHENSVRWAS